MFIVHCSAFEFYIFFVTVQKYLDDRPDLITANQFTNDLSVLLGDGDGTFQMPRRWSAGQSPAALVVVDVNADGAPDLIAANQLSNDVSVLLDQGDGMFQDQQRFLAGGNPISMAAADLNSDATMDLITANFGSGDLSLLLGNGDGTFRTAQNIAARRFLRAGPPAAVRAGGLSHTNQVWLGFGNVFPRQFPERLQLQPAFPAIREVLTNLVGDAPFDLSIEKRFQTGQGRAAHAIRIGLILKVRSQQCR